MSEAPEVDTASMVDFGVDMLKGVGSGRHL